MGNFHVCSNTTWCRGGKIRGNVVPELSKFPLHEYIEGVVVKLHVSSSLVLDRGEWSQSGSGLSNPRKEHCGSHCIEGRV
jgi:hypothetical protein